MMDGVRVLSQEAICSAGLKPVDAALFIIVAINILFIVSAIENNDFIIFVCGVLVSIVFGMLMWFVIDVITETPTGRYEYKVLIDDSVSMTEFYERYDLISVDGQIYTIRDKEVDK